MNQPEIIALKLVPALKECATHQSRLCSAWVEAVGFPALQEGATTALSESEIRTLDQLVFRFGKLQDGIATRLLPATLQVLQEWRESEPFMDKLNRAEKLNLLGPVEQWQILREFCNQTAHEYPDDPARMMENLRRLVAHVPMLTALHEHLAVAAKARVSLET